MKLDSKLVMLRGGDNGSKFKSCLSKKNYDNKSINKKPSNIGIKVPDVEWQTTGRNIRPVASIENPEEYNKIREFGCRRGYHYNSSKLIIIG